MAAAPTRGYGRAMTEDLIAVTGATGMLGSRLAVRLAAEGATQRLLVRDAARAPDVAHLPGIDVAVVPGGYRDAAAMRAALEGARSLFLVSGRESADRVTEHRTAIDAAADAGVERVVYVSFLGASPDATFTFARDHWATEEHLRASGLRFTALRDSLYLAMLPRMVGSDGVIRGPGGAGRFAPVAHDDVADVATAVLLDDREGVHDGQVYDVTGPELLTFGDAAAELRRVTGRDISYYPETLAEAFASRAGYGAEQFEVEGWVTSYSCVAAGELAVVSPTVERLAGRPAQTMAQWLEANPDEWAHLRG